MYSSKGVINNYGLARQILLCHGYTQEQLQGLFQAGGENLVIYKALKIKGCIFEEFKDHSDIY